MNYLRILAAVFFAAAAFAGIVTTQSNTRWELHEKSTNALLSWPADREACVTAAAQAPGVYTCVMRFDVTAVGVCDDVAKPTPEPPQTDLWAVQDPIDDTVWHNYVPGWMPADYAAGCWKLGQVELVYDPNAPTDEPVHEPVCQPALGECPP